MPSTLDLQGMFQRAYDDAQRAFRFVAASGTYAPASASFVTVSAESGLSAETTFANALSTWSKVVRKTADETVNNSVALQDDDHLSFAIGANETWVGQVVIFYLGNATADLKTALTIPAGASIMVTSISARTSDEVVVAGGKATPVSGSDFAIGASATLHFAALLHFSIANAGTAGTVQLQWAQNVATVADTTVKAGSHILARKVA